MDSNAFKMKISFLLFVFIPCFVMGQSSKQNSAYPGNLIVSGGLGSNYFTPSNIDFSGNSFGFQFENAKFTQANTKAFSFNDLSNSQYHFNLGYTIKRGVQLSIGLDNIRYNLSNQALRMNGFVEPGYDQIGGLSGSYQDFSLDLDSTDFRFGVSGAKYINLQLNLVQNLYRTSSRNFVINGLYGLGLGAIHTTSNVVFGTAYQDEVRGLSGWAVDAKLALRFEFFRHLFLQTSLTGGFLSQNSIQIDNSSASSKVFHQTLRGQGQLSIGTVLYFKGKKNCDCPSF